MLTLRFIRNVVGDDPRREKVYSVSQYEKVKEHPDETVVYFESDEEDVEITITKTPSYGEYNVCYVENAAGKTIDGIHPKK